MEALPAWALLLAAGVSFGFGAGGAWITFGHRLKRLEEWKTAHGEASDLAVDRLAALEKAHTKLDQIVTGPSGRNGHTRDIRWLRWCMHDVLGWIATYQGTVGEFRRSPRPED